MKKAQICQLLFVFICSSVIICMEQLGRIRSLKLQAARSLHNKSIKDIPNELAEFLTTVSEIDMHGAQKEFLFRVLDTHGVQTVQNILALLLHIQKSDARDAYQVLFTHILADVNHVFDQPETLFAQLHGLLLSEQEMLTCDIVTLIFLRLFNYEQSNREALILLLKQQIKLHALKSSDRSKSVAKLLLGLLCIREHKPQEATQLLISCATSGCAGAHYYLGKIYEQDKKYTEARVHFEQAADDNYPGAVIALGVSYLGKGEISAAKKCLKKLLNQEKNKEAHELLAICYTVDGKKDKANEQLRQAACLLGQPGSGEPQPDEALDHHTINSFSVNKKVEMAHLLAYLFSIRGKVPEAINCLEELADISTSETYFQLAVLNLIPGQEDTALGYLFKATKNISDNRLFYVGQMFKKLDCLEDAQKYLLKAAEHGDTKATALLEKINRKWGAA